MTTKAVGRKRLAKLADFLEIVPSKRFGMTMWAYTNNQFVLNNKGEPVVTTAPECRTSACALGWATAVFPRELALRVIPINPKCRCSICRLENRVADVVLRKDPNKEGFAAAEEFFSLSEEQALTLFDVDFEEHGPMTPKKKARQIRQFIKSEA